MPANSMQLRPGQTGICGPAEARISLLKGKEGAGRAEPTPTPPSSPPPLPPPYSNTHPHHPMPPRVDKMEMAGKKLGRGKGTNQQQDRADRARRKRCRAHKNKERKNGKESLWLLEAPVTKIIVQMHTPARSSQCWSRQTPAWTRSVHLDASGQRHGQGRWKICLRPGGGGHGCRLKEGGGVWEMDTCDRTYACMVLIVSLFFLPCYRLSDF